MFIYEMFLRLCYAANWRRNAASPLGLDKDKDKYLFL